MEHQRDSNGWRTFLEHWGLAFPGVLAFGIAYLGMFVIGLRGAAWIWGYSAALIVGAFAVGLLFYAKLPLYRQRRFFTFGARALPEERRVFYRWGHGFAVFSIALLACLLLSRH